MVLGIGYGGCIALNPAVLAQMFGVDRLGGLVGLMYTSAGIGTLIGPLAAGFLIDVTGTYRWAIAGCFILATGRYSHCSRSPSRSLVSARDAAIAA
jgi:MFS family permease